MGEAVYLIIPAAVFLAALLVLAIVHGGGDD